MRGTAALGCVGLLAALSALTPGSAGAVSTDIAAFSTSVGAPPNVLLLLDTSGSMGGEPDACASKVVGSDDCDAKKVLARKAIKSLVETVNPSDGSGGYVENARFGIFKFDTDQISSDPNNPLAIPLNQKKGGQVWFPIEPGNTAAIISGALDIPQAGGTLLGNQLLDAGRYFAAGAGWGELPLFGSM